MGRGLHVFSRQSREPGAPGMDARIPFRPRAQNLENLSCDCEGTRCCLHWADSPRAGEEPDPRTKKCLKHLERRCSSSRESKDGRARRGPGLSPQVSGKGFLTGAECFNSSAFLGLVVFIATSMPRPFPAQTSRVSGIAPPSLLGAPENSAVQPRGLQ